MRKINISVANTTVLCYEISRKDYTMGISESKDFGQPISDIYTNEILKPDIMITGGFLGLNSGYPNIDITDTTIFTLFNNYFKYGIGVTKDNNIEFGDITTGNYVEFISGYPCLVDNGSICKFNHVPELKDNKERAIFGMNNEYYYVVISKKDSGISLDTAAKIMINLGCSYAINLNGGDKSNIIVNGTKLFDDESIIDNTISFYKTRLYKNVNKVRPCKHITVTGDYDIFDIAEKETGNILKGFSIMKDNIGRDSSTMTINNFDNSSAKYFLYIISKGDSLSSIAQEYLTSPSRYREIMRVNNLTDTKIRVGQIIKIPM